MSDPKKVLVITIDHPWFDIRVYYKIIGSLLKQGVTIHLITACQNTNDSVTPENGFTYEIIPRKRSKQKILKDLICKGRQYTPYATICIEPLTLLAGLAIKKTTGCLVVYDCHEFYSEAFAERHPHFAFLYKMFEAYYAKRVDAIITVNEILVNQFMQHNPHTYLCANYPLQEATQAPTQHPPKIYDAVYVGSLAFERGLKIYLETARHFKDRQQPFSLLIVGNFKDQHTQQYFEQYIATHNLQAYITYKLYMPHKRALQEILQAKVGLFFADTATSPRYNRGLNVKIFDYLTQKVPTIINNLNMLADYVMQADCGWVVGFNSEDLYKCLCEVITNETLLTQKGKNGYQYLINHNIWENQEPVLYKAIFGE